MFLETHVLVNRIRPNPAYLLAHNTTNTTLQARDMAKYYMMSVELKTFTFYSGSQSLSIDNAVLGPLPILIHADKEQGLSRLCGYKPVPIPAL